MNRLDATRQFIAAIGDDPRVPIVTNLGNTTFDLVAVRDRPANFYLWGAMGMASSVGLGLAIAQPDTRVYVLDGDGSLLMNLGSLATIGWVRPINLVVIVWDNQEHATTGGQETATKHNADLEAAAKAMGFTATATVRDVGQLTAVIARARVEPGPWMIVAKVQEATASPKQPFDCVAIKHRFMTALGHPEPHTS